MLKHLTKLLLVAALLLPWATKAQTDTLTVADGTTTSAYVPFYGNWMDAVQHNQVIYPASMTATMVGDSIKGMAFYFQTTASNSWGTTATIKLGITSDATLTGLNTNTALTQVWSGTVTGTTTPLWIEFDEAYPFQGGNLLLDITTTVGNYQYAYFYGITQTAASFYSYNGNSYVQSFIPKTSFLHVEGDFEVCHMPSNLTPIIDSNQIVLTWTAAEEVSSYNVYMNDSLLGSTTDTFYTVWDLTPNTVYTFSVASDCGSNESPAIAGTYRTECGAITIPFTANFDSDPYGVFPPCWTLLHAYNTDPSVNTVFAHSGTQSMYLMAYYDYNMFAGQQIPLDGDEIKVDFWARMSNTYDGWLQAGVLTDVNDTTTFKPLMMIRPSDGDWHHYEFSTHDLDGSETYRLAYRYYGTEDYNDGASAIDDITIDVTDGCAMPREVAFDEADSNSVSLHWVAGAATGNYVLAYNTSNDFTTATLIEDLSDTSYVVTDLNPNQIYYFWVYNVCGDSTSLVFPAGSIRTACASKMVAPVSEDFSSFETYTLPTCWTLMQSYQSYDVFPYIDYSHELYFYAGYQQPNLIAMPTIDLAPNQMAIRVKGYVTSYSPATLEVGYVTNLDSADSFQALGTITATTPTEYEFATSNVTADSIWIAFRASTTGQDGYAYINSVEVEYLSPCARPDYLVVDSTTESSIVLHFDGTDAGEYEVVLSTVNDVNYEDAIVITTSDTTLEITDLEAATTYFTWVRAICDDDEASSWRQGTAVRTDCGTDFCFLSLDLTGQYTDSWTGSYIEAYANGALIGEATVPYGQTTNSEQFKMCNADTLMLKFHAGNYPSELTYTVTHAGVVYPTQNLSSSSNELFVANGCPDCKPVSDLVADETLATSSSVTVSWTAGSENDVEWIIYVNGTAVDNSTETEYTITDLEANTAYTIGVATLCLSGDTSSITTITTGTACGSTECTVELQMYTTYTYGYGYYNNTLDLYQNGNYKGTYTTPNSSSTFEHSEYASVCEGDSIELYLRATGATYYIQYLGARILTLTGDTIYNSEGTVFAAGYVGVSDTVACPSCIAPKTVKASNVTKTTADLSWTANATASNWDVTVMCYDTVAYYTTSNINELSLTGLMPATMYTVMVRSICSEDDTSIATTMTFLTECDVVTIPWSFNATTYTGAVVDQMPVCWTRPSTYSGTYPYLSEGYYFYANSYSSEAAMGATPLMPLAGNELYVKFHGYAYTSNTNSEASVGIMTDVNDPTTYIPLYYFSNSFDYVFEEHDFGTDNVPGIDDTDTVYVAFKATNATLYLRDISVSILPDCGRPDSISVTNITGTSADVSWPSTGANSYTLWYGDTVITTTSTSVTLNNLLPGATYNLSLQANCTADSSIIQHETFSTLCMPMTLPYAESFENFGAYTQPNCWTVYNEYPDYDGNMSPAIYPYMGSIGSKSLLFYGTSAVSPWGISPALTGAELNALYVSFDAYGYCSFEAGIMTDPDDTTTFTSLLSVTPDYNWTEYSFMTSSLTGTDSVYYLAIHMVNTSSYSQNFYIDNINVVEMPECSQEFASINTGLVTGDGATISWTPGLGVNANSSYTLYILNENNALVNSYSNVTSPLTVAGLSGATTYKAYVSLTCGGSTTATSDTISFTTWCANLTMAYNFDNTQSANTSNYSPIGYSYYRHAYTQNLIDSAYLADLGGDIIGFGFSPNNTINGSYYTQMTVYMANVPDTDLSSGWILPDSAHVFHKVIVNGDFNFSTTDWQIHHLDSAFTWDGHSNVLIAVTRDHGSYGEYSQSFNAHTTSAAKVRYSYTDGGAYDITNPTSASSSSYSSYYSGDIVLLSCGVGCEQPTSLIADDITYFSANLSWSGSNDAYELRYKASTDAEWGNTVSLTAQSYALTDIAESTTYLFQVRGLCIDGTDTAYSDWSEGSFTTLVLPCFAPTDLAVSEVTYGTATIDWTENGIATSWNIRVWNTQFDETFTTSSHPYTITGLAQNTQYNIAVSSQCSTTMESEYSTAESITTLTCQPVTGLTVTSVTATTATIAWSGNAIGYDIEYGDRNFSVGVNTTVTSSTTTSFTIVGLEPDYEYSVSVRAKCEDGVYSSYCAQVDFTTLAQGEGIESAGTANVNIYPNPTTDAATIAISGVNGEVEITLVDLSGRVVLTDKVGCDGECAKRLQVSGLAQGAYFVRLSGENVNMVKKLVVK